MSVRTPAYLKGRFENGDIPTGSDYGDIFDSFLPLLASTQQTITAPFRVNDVFDAIEVVTPLVSAGVVNATQITASTLSLTSISVTQINASIFSAASLNANAVSAVSINTVSIDASAATIDTIGATAVSADVVSANSLYANSLFSVSGPYYQSTLDVSAVATTQASALLVNGLVTFVIQADNNNNAVRLPTSDRGRKQYVVNASTTVVKIFPATSGRFVTTAVNASLNIPEGRTACVLHKGDDRYGIMIG